MRRSLWLAAGLAVAAAAAVAQQAIVKPAQVNGGVYLASPPTLSDQQTEAFLFDINGNLKVVSAGGGSGGTSSSFGATFPATGTAIGVKSGANMVNLTADGSNNLNVDLATALPAGSSIVGKVGIDQTTPGTTNGVQINAAIPAGGNTIGAVTQASGPWTVNEAQINGVTPLMGNGTTGTGSQRITISSDNSAVAGLGAVATGAAPPANAIYLGANASGATGGHVAGLIVCDNHVFKHVTSATDTLLVQGVASQTVYVCGAKGQFAGTATYFLENTASTNANCASANTQIAGVVTGAAQSEDGFYNPIWGGEKNTSGNGLCLNSTGTGGFDLDLWYTQF